MAGQRYLFWYPVDSNIHFNFGVWGRHSPPKQSMLPICGTGMQQDRPHEYGWESTTLVVGAALVGMLGDRLHYHINGGLVVGPAAVCKGCYTEAHDEGRDHEQQGMAWGNGKVTVTDSRTPSNRGVVP